MTGQFVPEKQLIGQLRAGNPEALSYIYDQYSGTIYRYIFFKVSTADEAQDLTSEVFLKFWQQCQEGKEIRTLKSYIYRIAHNIVVDHYRKQSLKQTSFEQLNDVQDVIADETRLEDEIISKNDLEFISAKIRLLKDDYREVLVMRYLDDLDIKDIAHILNKSQGAVRVLLHRALQSLKTAIEPNSQNDK